MNATVEAPLQRTPCHIGFVGLARTKHFTVEQAHTKQHASDDQGCFRDSSDFYTNEGFFRYVWQD